MGSKGVAEIMDAHIFETCGLSDPSPRLLDIHQVLLVNVTCDDERIASDLGRSFKFLDCGLTKVDRLLAGLGVRQMNQLRLEIDIGPFELLDFTEAAAREDQKANAGDS